MLRAPYVKVTESAREESKKKKRALEDSNIIKGWALQYVVVWCPGRHHALPMQRQIERERDEQTE